MAEEEDVAIGVFELKAAQAIVGVLEWLGKLDVAGGEFGG